MKINQVEELVGITKKNIRFYEEQGLICPDRDRNNGYREYNLDDVKKLNQIKLLRRLEVPIEEIRKIQTRQCQPPRKPPGNLDAAVRAKRAAGPALGDIWAPPASAPPSPRPLPSGCPIPHSSCK